MDREKVLFAMLRAVICGEPLSDEVKISCTQEMLLSVGALSKRHDLLHLVSKAASVLNLPEGDLLNKYRYAEKEAFFRHLRLSCEYERVCKALEEAAIPFVPLKGSILRDYYPEPWMRTSCDIDILVKEEMLEQAVHVLKQGLNYTEGIKGNHDVPMLSPAGVSLELHYDTVPESYNMEGSTQVLSRIWEDVTPKQPGAYQCVMSDAMFYFYHIAHMARHMDCGGCGIRPFVDLWILNHRIVGDAAQRKQLLEKGGLLAFGETAERLSEVWFSGAQPDSLTTALEQFILNGGVYGSVENSVAIRQKARGGKLGYALSRIWIPYEHIKYSYPVLQKHKWLTPFYQIVRWCRLLFRGGMKRSIREFQVNATVSREEIASVEDLMKNLGLK